MFVTLKMLLRTLVLPPSGPLIIAALGLVLLARRQATVRARRAGLVLALLGCGSLWLLSLPVVADALWHAAEREPALASERVATAQAIVILAGGTARAVAPEYGGAPAAGDDLLERLAYGAYLARRTGLPLLITGTAPEIAAMRASLGRDFGIEPRWVEDRSRDTFENAAFSAPLLRADGVTRILLVTDAAHAHRAAAEFSAAGLAVVAAPEGLWAPPEPRLTRYLPHVEALKRSTQALYELLGDAARRVFAALGLRRQRG